VEAIGKPFDCFFLRDLGINLFLDDDLQVGCGVPTI
jgi:hypothetical protein